MRGFQDTGSTSMEAEQLNALSNSIQNLRERSAELRRYL